MREPSEPRKQLTFDEFLAIEASSDIRHEYVGGGLHAMTSGSEPHNLITLNIAALLWNAARGKGCRVFAADMLVKIDENAAYHPDVTVVCDPADTELMFKTRPCLVVEVLSSSTSSADRRDKLLGYRRLETLQNYLIVSQDERRVIRNFRDEAGAWWQEELGLGHSIELHCPETTLCVDEMYEGVYLPAE